MHALRQELIQQLQALGFSPFPYSCESATPPPDTARQNGFIYKVKTQANDYQNLKVDTLRVQNNRKLKSYTVEFFSGKFLSAPTGIRTHNPQI